MRAQDIRSVGSLKNHDGSVALSICFKNQNQPVFVTVSESELEDAGGTAGLTKNKQRAVDFYNKYGPGRPR